MTLSWDGDFERCHDCHAIIGKAYPEVDLDGPNVLYVIFDARYCGGHMAPGAYPFVPARPEAGEAPCERCGDTIRRTFPEGRWSSSEHGDVCYADHTSGHRIHLPAPFDPHASVPGPGPFDS